MHPAAYVTSIEGLAEFQAALITFTDKAKEALTEVEMDLRRTLDWLGPQEKAWQGVVRKAEDQVAQAKLDLARKRMMRIGDRPQDTSAEEKQLRRAVARLEHAEEKRERTRHWLRAFPDVMLDYEGPGRQLGSFLENQIPAMIAFLERKIDTLEQYRGKG